MNRHWIEIYSSGLSSFAATDVCRARHHVHYPMLQQVQWVADKEECVLYSSFFSMMFCSRIGYLIVKQQITMLSYWHACPSIWMEYDWLLNFPFWLLSFHFLYMFSLHLLLCSQCVAHCGTIHVFCG
jgi:hypothetical protein